MYGYYRRLNHVPLFSQDIARDAGISSIPTYQAYRNGEKLGELIGPAPRAELERDLINRNLI